MEVFTTYGIILYLHSTLRFRINAQQRIIKVQDITKDFLGIKKNTLYLIKNVYTIENFLHGYKEFHSKLWRTDLVIGTDLLLFFFGVLVRTQWNLWEQKMGWMAKHDLELFLHNCIALAHPIVKERKVLMKNRCVFIHQTFMICQTWRLQVL